MYVVDLWVSQSKPEAQIKSCSFYFVALERVLAGKLNLNYEEAERWIVNLIRSSKLDAKIDSETGTVIMEPNHPNVYEQLIEHTKPINGRTYKLVSQLVEHVQTQTAR
ncbi:hypothetical protein VNO78_30481 [Psophocarpus tetragonolobus]|uniref:PCI domain-containing protein n=1 Tax=Psophocarpus tetragonolobus TaxID=3891 RepID=A0AAN9X740_PSOTE